MSRLCSIRQRHRVEPVVPGVVRAELRLCFVSSLPRWRGSYLDGAGSTIEAGQIRDVSLTTRVTQRTTLHHDLVIIQPPSHDHTCCGRLQGVTRTNHETVQASPKLGTREQHPQRATVPLHE